MSERQRPSLALALGTLALLLVGWRTLQLYAPSLLALGGIVVLLLQLALLAAAFVGWGGPTAWLLGARSASLCLRWALGAALTATVTGALAPWWFPDARFVAPWAALGALIAVPVLRERWRPAGAATGGPSPFARAAAPGTRSILLWGLVVLFLLPPLLLALAPPVSLDSLVYHLAVPKQAALRGHLPDMPWMRHSYLPLGAEMLFGATLALDPGGRLAQLLHLLAAGVTLLVAARLARRCGGAARAGPWAALLLVSVPVLDLVAGFAWNDWFVLLYLALALEVRLARAPGSPGAAPPARAAPGLRVEAALLGAAVATKYVALPALLLLALPPRPRPRALAASAALVAALALPWYGRNLVLRGNPFYPLLSGDPAARALADFRGNGPAGIGPLDYLGRPDLADESLGVLLLPALAAGLVLLGRRLPPALAGLGAAYLLPLALTHPTARAFAPMLLLAAVAAAAGIASHPWSRPWRAALTAAAAFALFMNLFQIVLVLDRFRPLPVVAGLQSREEYLASPASAAFAWIDRVAPPGAGVLVVGESSVFDLDRPAIWGSYLDPHPLRSFLGGGATSEEAAQRLRAAGIRLVYFRPSQYRVGARPAGLPDELTFYADETTDRTFRTLLERRSRPVYHRDGVWVFALLPSAGATSAPAAGEAG
jgi:hypothetical protein